MGAIPEKYPSFEIGKEVSLVLQVARDSSEDLTEISAKARIARIVNDVIEDENPTEHRFHRPGSGRGFGLEFIDMSEDEKSKFLLLLNLEE